jgi:signal transduction histidine kinase
VTTRLRLYLIATGVAAAIALGANWPADFATMGIHYAIWAAICVFSETMWLSSLSGSGTWSMSSTAILATVVLYGYGPAIWIAAVSTPIAEVFVQRKPLIRAYFNSAQIAITMWAASAAFVLLGGPLHGLAGMAAAPGVAGSGGAMLAIRLAPPVVALFVFYLLVNRCLVAVAVSWSTERKYLRVLREDWFYAARLLEDAAAFFLSPLMVISYQAIGYLGVGLFYAPIRMIYESEKRYVELRRAQEQAIHSERMAAKGEMAAEIGHELRNQLAAISGRAQMILKEVERGGPAEPKRHAEIILEQSRRMEGLSKGLMDFSRAELTIERVDVNALIQRTIEFVRGQNRFDGVEWEIALAERLPELRADPGQLQQVLLNLFMNAADAMQDKTRVGRRAIYVTSEADERGGVARVRVRDTGTGIPASNLARIFEPHFTTKREGHGFGLSTSYRIITNHGGKIVVESPIGQGASFTVVLPLQGPGAWGGA